MGNRKTPLTNNEYYHIFNRGVDKRSIFSNAGHMRYFFRSMRLLNTTSQSKGQSLTRLNLVKKNEELVNIVAYALLPNHFHFLLKQNVEGGIAKFMQKLGTSYTMFFNKQEGRSGALFQGRFKSNHLAGDFALPTLSAYINLNYKHHKIDPSKNLVQTSLPEYLGTAFDKGICNQVEIDSIIYESNGLEDYKKYIKQASIAFADNKNIILLKSEDFEW